MVDRESPMRMLDRSLAYTALRELSPEFAASDLPAGTATITKFLDEYYEWLDQPEQARVPFTAGVHDIFTYARSWLREQDNQEGQ